MVLESRGPGAPWRFRLMVGGCAASLVLGVTGALAFSGSRRHWLVLVALAGLFVAAEHRDRLFTDETGLSGSIAVATAAAMYFGASYWVGGAFLVCMAGGLYLPHLRSRDWSKVVVNAACFALSGVAASAVVSAASIAGAEAPALALVAVPTAFVYWIVNSFLLSLATTSLRGGSLLASALDLIKSDTVMLVFAVGGALCGLVMIEVAPWVGIVSLVASLVALDVFVISAPAGPAVLRSSWKMLLTRLAAGGAAGVVAAMVAAALAAPALGIAVGLLTGVVVGLLVAVVASVARMLLAGGRIDGALLLGFGIGELPLVVIASCAGALGGELGAAAGFVTASLLVVAASLITARRRSVAPSVPVDDDILLAAVTEAILDGMPESLPQR